VGLAFRQNNLYMLSMYENVNVVCNDENVVCKDKVSSSTNVSSKCKRCDYATFSEIVALSFSPHYEGGLRG
jgi:hypothetical protein